MATAEFSVKFVYLIDPFVVKLPVMSRAVEVVALAELTGNNFLGIGTGKAGTNAALANATTGTNKTEWTA